MMHGDCDLSARRSYDSFSFEFQELEEVPGSLRMSQEERPGSLIGQLGESTKHTQN